MKVTDVSLRRPVTVLTCMAALVLFGLMTLSSMGVQRLPDVDFPVVAVTTTMTGTSPAVMDNDVTDVIEEELSTISGIEDISSYSYEGRSVTVVQFELDRDIDAAAADVRDKVNLVLGDLPDDAETPVVQKFNMGDDAIVTLAVTGEAPYREKVLFADKIASPRFQSVDGVGSVSTPGLREREIRVWLDPAKLEARGLVVKDVKDAISDKHVELPAGRIETDLREYELKLEGEYGSVEELETLPIVTRDGAVVRLGEVARIEDGFEDRRSVAKYDGEETILLQIGKQRGANEVSVAAGIMGKVEELKRNLPPGVEILVLDNQATFVKESMQGVTRDVIMAIALCSLIMLFFLMTFRATFVTVITIPICLLGSFIVLPKFGVTINNLSMMGVSLAVGMVVDATTVVLENVHRHMEEGMPARQAASTGTSEVSFSVLAGAATTIAVFAPIAFMGGIVGRFFYHFGVTVVFTMVLSLITSLTLTPFLCSRILHKDHPGPVARAIERILEGLERGYSRLLELAVRFRWVTVAGAVGLFIFGMTIASHVGMGFFPSEDNGTFSVSFELPAETSIVTTETFLEEMDAMVRADDAVDFTFATIGTGMGQEVYKGDISVQLKPKEERDDIDTVMARMRQNLSVFRDATLTLATWGEADVTMTLVGDDTEELASIAAEVLADLSTDGRLTDLNTDIRLDKPRYNIRLNRSLTDDMDLNIRDLSSEIYTYFGGVKTGVFKEGGYRYDIRLKAEGDSRTGPEDIENLAVHNGDGKLVRVPGLVEVEKGYGPNMVTRYGRRRSLQISANCVAGVSLGEGASAVAQAVTRHLPEDGSVQILATGSSKHMVENMQRILKALATAIILVYMVMAIQFESFLHPFTVMFSLPLLTPGAFGLLLLTGKDIDMMSMMGIILLVGIVVNNAILLVDFANQQREKGEDKVTAMLKAGPLRLRPILMTALSTMVGSLPIALGLSQGSEFRQPMSIAVIGGLATSTMMTLFIIPVMYLILDDAKEKASSLVRWFRLRQTKKRMTRRKKLVELELKTESTGGK